MIINYDSPGQLCNRIWSLVPSIAYGLEHNEKVLLINFDEYTAYFEDLNKNKYVRFKSRTLLKRIFMSLKSRGKIQNGRPNIFLKCFNLNLIEGWSNRLGNTEMVIKQSESIRHIFRFNNDVTTSVDKVFSSFTNEIIVGVHFRRGDYKEWLGGIYYYNDDTYCKVMRNMQSLLQKEGKQVKFLLCSNENINIENFAELDCFTIPQSSGAKDLYALSKCSYIIGPPSSYSEWASFSGKVPVKYIMSADEEIQLYDFSQIVALNKFENRKELILD